MFQGPIVSQRLCGFGFTRRDVCWAKIDIGKIPSLVEGAPIQPNPAPTLKIVVVTIYYEESKVYMQIRDNMFPDYIR